MKSNYQDIESRKFKIGMETIKCVDWNILDCLSYLKSWEKGGGA